MTAAATWTGRLAAALLVSGAVFHVTGWKSANSAASELDPPFLSAAFGPLWLIASLNWAALACLAALMAGQSGPRPRAVLTLSGLAVLSNALAMALGGLAGFVGTHILALCGGLFLVSAALVGRS